MPSLPDPVPPAAQHDLPSLPATQRHASFPPPPPDLAALLPPGLSLTRLGCAAAEDDDDHGRAGPGPYTLARAASESLLFGGGGGSGGRISPPATTTTASSPPPPQATRHAPYGPGSELDWGLRRLSFDSNSAAIAGDAKAKRERAAVREGWEDPALAAARRALWADDADESVASIPAPASNGLVGSLAERSRTPRADADAAPSPAAASTSQERRDQAGSPEATADDNDDDDDDNAAYALLLPPPACMPCHATLSPRASCLRNSPLARSASLALSCSTSSFSSDSSPVSLSDSAALPPSDSDTPPTTSSSRDRDLLQHRRRNSSSGGRLSPSATSTSTASTSAPPSVSFSPAPPLEGATYSAVDYERGGDGPVEKLSVREWIELQGVREAVGVWSGKIEPWSAELEAALQNAAADLGGGGGDGSGAAGKRFGSSQASPSSCTAPAALVGVVQVTKSAHNSPVLGSAPLWR